MSALHIGVVGEACLKLLVDSVGLLVVPSHVEADTCEEVDVYEAVGVVATEEVGHVEHSVDRRSDVCPFPFVAVLLRFAGNEISVSDLACSAASPAVYRETKTEHRRELIAAGELGIGACEDIEATFAESLLGTELSLTEPIRLEDIFGDLFLSGGTESTEQERSGQKNFI